jgi:hypothetical protein
MRLGSSDRLSSYNLIYFKLQKLGKARHFMIISEIVRQRLIKDKSSNIGEV